VVEEIGPLDGSLALTVASHNGSALRPLALRDRDLRRRYIPEIAAGRKLAAWALTEPGSGSDAAGMRTTAVRKDKAGSSTARRCSSPQGTVGDVFVVLALSDPGNGRKA